VIITRRYNWNVNLQIEEEFKRAEEARARGNEGQARVCARRAAGMAARDYLARRGEVVRTPSAYDLLQTLAHDSSLASDLRQSAAYLTLRVNEEFKMPVDVDLIAEARKLCKVLST
jgi:HEPN domain-containing protein